MLCVKAKVVIWEFTGCAAKKQGGHRDEKEIFATVPNEEKTFVNEQKDCLLMSNLVYHFWFFPFPIPDSLTEWKVNRRIETSHDTKAPHGHVF